MHTTQTERIAMLLENNPYPQDVRVRAEAQSLARAGHHVTVIAPSAPGQPRREQIRGVNVVRFDLIDGSTRGIKGFVAEYLMAAVRLHVAATWELMRGATVLHLHNPPDIFFPAGALYRLAGRKVVFDHHDLFPETLQVKFGSRRAAALARLCQRLTIAIANHVIATNASYADVALGSGKSADRVTVVRNAPPSAWLDLEVPERQGALETLRLVYLGAISSQDGVDGLAPVLSHLVSGEPPLDATLTVIGDGDARADLERAFIAHGVRDRVTFTGRVPADAVPALIGAADVCVDPAPPTDVNERSTMTKIAEYLALGKPVVAYDLLETRRTAGDAAMLVEKGNAKAFAAAIIQLARDGGLRARLASAARRRASEELTWEHSERALFEAYRALRWT